MNLAGFPNYFDKLSQFSEDRFRELCTGELRRTRLPKSDWKIGVTPSLGFHQRASGRKPDSGTPTCSAHRRDTSISKPTGARALRKYRADSGSTFVVVAHWTLGIPGRWPEPYLIWMDQTHQLPSTCAQPLTPYEG